MDYKAIGQRIRKFRKAKDFSQEKVAEKVGISTTHMSHIETGNTKLSLPVIVDIAEVLGVRVDDLLNDVRTDEKSVTVQAIEIMLSKCDDHEIYGIAEVVRALTTSMKKGS